MEKTRQEAIRPIRRPNLSPKGEAARAPKKVPADKIETINEVWLSVNSFLPFVANSLWKKSMARIPLMVPVSYLIDCQLSNTCTESRSTITSHQIHPRENWKLWKRVEVTYPKRIPPKATKRPMRIAGKALPGSPSGFLMMKPITGTRVELT